MLNNVDYLLDFIDDFPIGIISLDTTTEHIVLYNKYLLQMIGWPLSEIDTMDKWFRVAYPDDEYRANIMKEWGEIVDEAESQNKPYSRCMEAKVACKNGTFKWFSVRYYRKGHLVYGIFIDITERKKAEKKLKNLSLIDPLTGIHNRRYFNIEYYKKWREAQRTEIPLSLIVCDIDNFKKINDTFGHIVGDQVIVAFAKAISSTLKRSTDFVARYGGEEFVVVSYDCDENSALELCKLIKSNIDQVSIPSIKSSNHHLSMSFGISTTIPNPNITAQQFLNSADQAMYRAKKTGKDKIVIGKLESL
ncbi:diguanylate cyclase/phosphodiesterase (GGDEF & EAL domains) with PAS/PAC sensor(s) [hydrothermal vent metagenome]|uniref:Diguanylate cyclase/phosphodiesterase (GGDEF & EAL domains) with PAS/PAC sensor(S) n=1 Tax=hydrothermal vent metagenome TaxID=652676 RepID=A0A1W1CAI5_9ZZZZ